MRAYPVAVTGVTMAAGVGLGRSQIFHEASQIATRDEQDCAADKKRDHSEEAEATGAAATRHVFILHFADRAGGEDQRKA
jgi:hypothetical protein